MKTYLMVHLVELWGRARSLEVGVKTACGFIRTGRETNVPSRATCPGCLRAAGRIPKSDKPPRELNLKLNLKTGQLKRIKPRTKKRAKQDAIYGKRVEEWLREPGNQFCRVYPSERATQCHHMRGRSGYLLLDERFWVPVSAKGHRWIDANRDEARAKGVLADKGDWLRREEIFVGDCERHTDRAEPILRMMKRMEEAGFHYTETRDEAQRGDVFSFR